MKFIKIFSICLASVILMHAPVYASAEGDADRGKKLSKKLCGTCHLFTDSKKKKLGPTLFNVVNRKIASIEGFKYSKAMSQSDLVWTEENLKTYLKKPRKVFKKTKMSFKGIKKEQDIEDVVAYLKTLK